MGKKSIIFIVIVAILLVWNGILTSQINEYRNQQEVEEVEGPKEYLVSGFSTDLTKVADTVSSGVVTILSADKVSSGFIYKKVTGGFYVVTCAHSVVDESSATVVLDSSSTYTGSVVGSDPFSDIAVLKVEDDIVVEASAIGDNNLLKAGEFVLCMGTPTSVEFKNSVNFGIVSSGLRTVTNSISLDGINYNYYTSLIQLSSAVDSGYSGAPCFNMSGEVVGMLCMKSSSEVMALPINEIKIVANKIINDEVVDKTHYGFKGVFINSLKNYEKSNMGINLEIIDGLFITEVQPNSLASVFGIATGDVITSINSIKIANNDDYLNAAYGDNENFTIDLYRNSELMTITGSVND